MWSSGSGVRVPSLTLSQLCTLIWPASLGSGPSGLRRPDWGTPVRQARENPCRKPSRSTLSRKDGCIRGRETPMLPESRALGRPSSASRLQTAPHAPSGRAFDASAGRWTAAVTLTLVPSLSGRRRDADGRSPCGPCRISCPSGRRGDGCANAPAGRRGTPAPGADGPPTWAFQNHMSVSSTGGGLIPLRTEVFTRRRRRRGSGPGWMSIIVPGIEAQKVQPSAAGRGQDAYTHPSGAFGPRPVAATAYARALRCRQQFELVPASGRRVFVSRPAAKCPKHKGRRYAPAAFCVCSKAVCFPSACLLSRPRADQAILVGTVGLSDSLCL